MIARAVTVLIILVSIGCLKIGDQGIPFVSETAIPKSTYRVILHGPVDNGEYFYTVFDPTSKSFGSQARDLGSAHVDESMPPDLQEEAPGVYRITWGSGPYAAYAVIDMNKRRFVEDANPANPRNEPFVFEGVGVGP